MRSIRIRIVCALLAGALPSAAGPPAAQADVLEMKTGMILSGKYAGGTAGTIRIETADGVKVLQTADVLAITFSAVAPAPAPAVAAPAQAMPVMVPAGSVLTVRMESQVSSNDPPGKKFSAKLLADLMAGDATVAKAGTVVYGQVEQSAQAGRLAGKSKLALTLTGIDFAGKIQPILTTNFAEAGKGEFRKTARNVAGGALIGNAVNNDGGAGVGAAVGVGVSLIKKGDSVTVPQGAILEFRLTQPIQTTSG